MATEYDLHNHPELNPVIQNKVARTVQTISKLCIKVCYRNKTPSDSCLENCVTSYIQAFHLVVNTLEHLNKE